VAKKDMGSFIFMAPLNLVVDLRFGVRFPRAVREPYRIRSNQQSAKINNEI
jgi:hypothetical protein